MIPKHIDYRWSKLQCTYTNLLHFIYWTRKKCLNSSEYSLNALQKVTSWFDLGFEPVDGNCFVGKPASTETWNSILFLKHHVIENIIVYMPKTHAVVGTLYLLLQICVLCFISRQKDKFKGQDHGTPHSRFPAPGHPIFRWCFSKLLGMFLIFTHPGNRLDTILTSTLTSGGNIFYSWYK